jgi:hypothetical protein
MRLAAGGSKAGFLPRRFTMPWKAPGLFAARSKVAPSDVQSSSTLEEADWVFAAISLAAIRF